MRRFAVCLLALPLVPAMAAGDGLPAPSQDEIRVMTEDRLDSRRLEGELQSLDWEQFRSVVEAIPKLKADVDAYGPMGWEFVKERYKTHEWRKNIDKLGADDKRRLAALIETAAQRE